ncbi:hypothetical protein [Salinicola peritrichatus]|uniref:hypothetical protein n=1 Tax=Salinicola peritrichatus TaxID=1267424 RepID=UPI000DA1EE32|nr:hypothetical protein [Salinicola peritrichatus]
MPDFNLITSSICQQIRADQLTTVEVSTNLLLVNARGKPLALPFFDATDGETLNANRPRSGRRERASLPHAPLASSMTQDPARAMVVQRRLEGVKGWQIP